MTLASLVALAALLGCSKDAAKRAKLDDNECALAADCAGSGSGSNGRGDAHGSGDSHDSAVDGVTWPTTAPELPGVIYFRSARGMERIAEGERELVGAGLYPSSQRVGSELVAIRSKGDGSADAEQIVVGTRPVGFTAAQVRDPAVDPQGQWIVVAATRDGHSDLYRIDVATGADTRLTNNAEGNFAPALLDAKTIVFTSSRDGDSELYRMPVAGGEATRLTAFHRDDWAPTPSPDGKRIAFVSDREGTPRIFVMSAKGTDLRRLTTRTVESEESAPVWSPDGKHIAYVVQPVGGAVAGNAQRQRSEVFIHDVAAKTERSITVALTLDQDPTFSPDGDYVLVSRLPPAGERPIDRRVTDDPIDRTDTRDDLWVVPLRGGEPNQFGEPIRLTNDVGSEAIPRWVPD